MNITPYTPVKILRRYVWRTYLEQALAAVLSVAGVLLTGLNLTNGYDAVSWTQFGYVRFGLATLSIVSMYFSAGMVINGCTMFIKTASLRGDLVYLMGLRARMDQIGRNGHQ